MTVPVWTSIPWKALAVLQPRNTWVTPQAVFVALQLQKIVLRPFPELKLFLNFDGLKSYVLKVNIFCLLSQFRSFQPSSLLLIKRILCSIEVRAAPASRSNSPGQEDLLSSAQMTSGLLPWRPSQRLITKLWPSRLRPPEPWPPSKKSRLLLGLQRFPFAIEWPKYWNLRRWMRDETRIIIKLKLSSI